MNKNELQALIRFFKHAYKTKLTRLDKEQFLSHLSQSGLSMTQVQVDKLLEAMHPYFHASTRETATYTVQAKLRDYPVQPHLSFRLYSEEEKIRISLASRRCLSKLELKGILSAQLREIIVDQLLEASVMRDIKISFSQTKWVIFQTLASKVSGQALAYLEWMLFKDRIELH